MGGFSTGWSGSVSDTGWYQHGALLFCSSKSSRGYVCTRYLHDHLRRHCILVWMCQWQWREIYLTWLYWLTKVLSSLSNNNYSHDTLGSPNPQPVHTETHKLLSLVCVYVHVHVWISPPFPAPPPPPPHTHTHIHTHIHTHTHTHTHTQHTHTYSYKQSLVYSWLWYGGMFCLLVVSPIEFLETQYYLCLIWLNPQFWHLLFTETLTTIRWLFLTIHNVLLGNVIVFMCDLLREEVTLPAN